MKSIQEIFPRASKSFVDANPQLSAPNGGSSSKNDVQVNSVPNGGRVEHSSGFDMVPIGRKGMNKTEAEFAMILEAQKRRGEVTRYEFEPMTLRFSGVKYTPDFIVFYPDQPFRLIEVKGGWMKGKFERAVERFRHARTYWPEFTFEMHQKTKEGWKQII